MRDDLCAKFADIEKRAANIGEADGEVHNLLIDLFKAVQDDPSPWKTSSNREYWGYLARFLDEGLWDVAAAICIPSRLGWFLSDSYALIRDPDTGIERSFTGVSTAHAVAGALARLMLAISDTKKAGHA